MKTGYDESLHGQNSGTGSYKNYWYTLDAPREENEGWLCCDSRFLAKGWGKTKDEAVKEIEKAYDKLEQNEL